MESVLVVPGRKIFRLHGAAEDATAYLVVDREAGGILVNTPPFSEALARRIAAVASPRYVFLPSHFGARDVDAWRARYGAQTLAFEAETPAIAGHVDIPLHRKSRLTRTIDFLLMSGRTRGSGALRLRNKPGVVFFGPILSPGESGWPTLIPRPDDDSYENRLLGVLGLQDVKYEYAFTDVFQPGHTRYGPGADVAIQAELTRALEL
ncbi:MAG: hypothetical protein B7Z66_02170 [Chromatiales bacterium 21-64-14]|nr:MAG: hypothetical protein B7Z66_02170 [Chromatiales bacterium 21-64-14]HQU16490.1 hypothetical protein [Gammaproteobacteria bacterium]